MLGGYSPLVQTFLQPVASRDAKPEKFQSVTLNKSVAHKIHWKSLFLTCGDVWSLWFSRAFEALVFFYSCHVTLIVPISLYVCFQPYAFVFVVVQQACVHFSYSVHALSSPYIHTSLPASELYCWERQRPGVKSASVLLSLMSHREAAFPHCL